MAITGFFDKIPAKHDKGADYSIISVGGEQFHALAVALIDGFKNSARADEPSLKKILERFYALYPKFISTQPCLTPTDRMNMLINNSRKSEVVDCMAYVLRQLAVDEIYEHPLNYRDVFKDLDPKTPKHHLRQPNTQLPASALGALTQIMALTLTLSFTEHSKELRRREVYTNNADSSQKLKLVVQVQGDVYFPQVRDRNKTAFAYVGQLAISSPKPLDNTTEDYSVIAPMLDTIAADNGRLRDSYEHSRKTLLSMVAAGELTKESLITLFIEFFPNTHGNSNSTTHFFADLENKNDKPVLGGQLSGLQQETNLLAEALAGWISTGLIDEDQFFDRLENKSSVSLAK